MIVDRPWSVTAKRPRFGRRAPWAGTKIEDGGLKMADIKCKN